MWEGAWRRAAKETQATVATIRFWLANGVVGVAVGAATQSALAGLLVALAWLVAVFAWHAITVPVRQRDEARLRLREILESAQLELLQVNADVRRGRFLMDLRFALVLKNRSAEVGLNYSVESVEVSIDSGGVVVDDLLNRGGAIPPGGSTTFWCQNVKGIPDSHVAQGTLAFNISFRPVPVVAEEVSRHLAHRLRVTADFAAGTTQWVFMRD